LDLKTAGHLFCFLIAFKQYASSSIFEAPQHHHGKRGIGLQFFKLRKKRFKTNLINKLVDN